MQQGCGSESVVIQTGRGAVVPGGREQPPDFPRETTSEPAGGAQSGAVVTGDADLTRIIDAWPALPPHIKAAILALIGTVR